VPAAANPGVMLGTVMGVAAKAGRDKLTLAASPALYDLGAWLEQLIAESTGKHGKGIIPVDLEPLTGPEGYGADRYFVYIRYAPAPDAAQDEAMAQLEAAGFPVVRIDVADAYDLGQEFFRWEFATAVAGSLMGINPFDQPDVEASKVATRKLTSEFEQTGTLAAGEPLFEDCGIRVYADAANAAALAPGGRTLQGVLRAHLGRLTAGDYFALLAYVDFHPHYIAALTGIRTLVRDATGNATCLGFGPRFLHSTGQAYKGGPNSGVFLQITADDAADLAVPGQKFSFGVVKAAQALGDLTVLYERERRALRLHLGADVRAGLARLEQAIREALPGRC
jgi:transaldolase/glucose-6-phosphate isomerase